MRRRMGVLRGQLAVGAMRTRSQLLEEQAERLAALWGAWEDGWEDKTTRGCCRWSEEWMRQITTGWQLKGSSLTIDATTNLSHISSSHNPPLDKTSHLTRTRSSRRTAPQSTMSQGFSRYVPGSSTCSRARSAGCVDPAPLTHQVHPARLRPAQDLHA